MMNLVAHILTSVFKKFNDLGFAFGDSVNLTFTTGDKVTKFEDIGYYSGYYVPAGQELVVG